MNPSLNSNSWNLAAVAIAFSRTINNLRTLMRSNALGFAWPVLAFYEFISGDLVVKDSEITTSPR